MAGTGINKEMKVSKELREVIGVKTVSRGQMMKGIWKYIKKHDLQNPKDKREILCDSKLRAVLGEKKINMFKMTKALGKHLS